MKKFVSFVIMLVITVSTLAGCTLDELKQAATMLQSLNTDFKITFAQGDSSESVTKDLILPTKDSSGTSITWLSSDPTVISNSGVVTRPARSMIVTMSGSAVTVSGGTTVTTGKSTKVRVLAAGLTELTTLQNMATDLANVNPTIQSKPHTDTIEMFVKAFADPSVPDPTQLEDSILQPFSTYIDDQTFVSPSFEKGLLYELFKLSPTSFAKFKAVVDTALVPINPDTFQTTGFTNLAKDTNLFLTGQETDNTGTIFVMQLFTLILMISEGPSPTHIIIPQDIRHLLNEYIKSHIKDDPDLQKQLLTYESKDELDRILYYLIDHLVSNNSAAELNAFLQVLAAPFNISPLELQQLANLKFVEMTAESEQPGIDAENEITLTIIEAGNVDQTFTGNKEVTVKLDASIDVTNSSFAGTPLSNTGSTKVTLAFDKGIAKAKLILHAPVAHRISFAVDGTESFKYTTFTPSKQGDLDGDGDVDHQDLTKLGQYLVGIGTLTDSDKKNADFDSNNVIDIRDWVKLMNQLATN